jgi:hypothetical protein
MYSADYFYSQCGFIHEGFLSGDGAFKYDFDLSVVYASPLPNIKILDFEGKKLVEKMTENPSGMNQERIGYFTNAGLHVKSQRLKRSVYSNVFTIDDFTLNFDGSGFKYAETGGGFLWVFSNEDKNQEFECFKIPSSNPVWRVSVAGYELERPKAPVKVGSNLVHNLGYQNSSNLKGYVEKFDGALLGLSLQGGREVWRTVFERMVSGFINVDERLIVAYLGYIVELDAETGDELKRFDTQLPEAHRLSCQYVGIWDVKDYLLFVSSGDFSISVHDRSTLEQIQVIRIPDPYDIDAEREPVVKEGSVYFALRGGIQEPDRPSDYLMMKLTPCELGAEPVSIMEEKPPHKISVISESQNQESYRIDLDAQTPDQLIRLAEVEVALIPGNHGKTMWGAPDINPKFNGKIAFYGTLPENISDTEIERTARYLKLLKEYWDKIAKGDMGPYGSVKGTLIDLSCYLNGEKIA